ncbi:hypothetical protein TWF281_001470 [Arthrobotrys megalospora]
MFFLSFPLEIHFCIAKELDLLSLTCLRATCKELNEVYTQYAFKKVVVNFVRPMPRNGLVIPRMAQGSLLALQDAFIRHISNVKVLGTYRNLRALDVPVFQAAAEVQVTVLLKRISHEKLTKFEWNLSFSEAPTTILTDLQAHKNLRSLRIRLSNAKEFVHISKDYPHWNEFNHLRKIHLEDLTHKADLALADRLITAAKSLREIRICFLKGPKYMQANTDVTTEAYIENKFQVTVTTDDLLAFIYSELAIRQLTSVYLSSAKLIGALGPLLHQDNLQDLTLKTCTDLAPTFSLNRPLLRLKHLNLHLRTREEWVNLMRLLANNLPPGLTSLSVFTESNTDIHPAFDALDEDLLTRHYQTLKSFAICHRDANKWLEPGKTWTLLDSEPRRHSLDEFLAILKTRNPERYPWTVDTGFHAFAARLRVLYIVPPREVERTKLDGGYRLSGPIHSFLQEMALTLTPACPRLECIVIGFRGEKHSVFKVTWVKNPHSNRPHWIFAIESVDVASLKANTDLNFHLYEASFAPYEALEVVPAFA